MMSCAVPASDAHLNVDGGPAIVTYSADLPEGVRSRSATLLDGAFWSVGADALPQARMEAGALQASLATPEAVFLIHGTMYDPTAPGLANPHLTLFVALRSMLGAGADATIGLGWNSVSFTPGNLWAAWRRGHVTWYGLAAERAGAAAARLSDVLSGHGSGYALVCHSIGCHIAWRAAAASGNPPKRMLMLSPDTDYAALEDWALAHGVDVLHVTAERDAVLPLSRFARRNRSFRPRPDQNGYRMHVVDVDAHLPAHPRISVRYANPRRFGDHMAVTQLPHLAPLYRDFLQGR